MALRAVRRVYDDANAALFAGKLRPPALQLSDSVGRLGCYVHKSRTLELARPLLVEHGWNVLVEVLHHEMAHQFVHEVLGVHDESAHGPAFRRVCQERGIDARAAGLPDPADPAETHVLERIAKLLALAESANEHEASAAMSAAQRLMLSTTWNRYCSARPRFTATSTSVVRAVACRKVSDCSRASSRITSSWR